MTIGELVKELRTLTGAGMLDCKKAIEACKGDLQAAKDWIRAKGLTKASNISGKTAAEGVAAVNIDGKKAIIIELNSQTDFVAKNEQFQILVTKILKAGINTDNLESLKTTKLIDGNTVSQEILNNMAQIGENLSLRRAQTIQVSNKGVIGYYIHNKVAPNMGRTAVLIALEADKKLDDIKLVDLQSLANNIAMHIAAVKPLSLSIEDLDHEYVEREKVIFQEQASSSGKPENVVTKMVEGMLKKFYTDFVLLEQFFVLDPKQKIFQILENASKESGAKITIKNFIKYEVGEGIVHNTKNFADEVASIIKQ